MKLKLAHAVGLIAVLFVPRALSQALLAEADLTQSGGINQITNTLNLSIRIGSPPASLFEDLWVQAGDVGHTYTLGSSGDADFTAFVDRLTDGQSSDFAYTVTVGNGSAGMSPFTELQFFTALPPGNNGVDLGGFQIDHFSLRFDTIDIVSPGSDPNGDGVWTDYSYSAVFSVYGQPVPEPTSLVLLGLGMILLSAKVRWLTKGLSR